MRLGTPQLRLSRLAYACAALALALGAAACTEDHRIGDLDRGSHKRCGGIAGTTCPIGEICTDDPADSCDPATGADCAGKCTRPVGEQCSAELPTNALCALTACAGGYKVLADGSVSCECCDSCPDVLCALYCENGYKKDAKGCSTCQCNDPPASCSPEAPTNALCAQACPAGYKVQTDGTVTCDCCTSAGCPGVNPQGCRAGTCPTGSTCKQTGDCVASACSCDPSTGSWLCTADCGGGTCVPDTCAPVVCALACPNGFKHNAAGCEICECEPTARTPASGQCVRNANDSCRTDADCAPGGCGGELCSAGGQGISTCDCTQPSGVSCGCVNNRCTWWK